MPIIRYNHHGREVSVRTRDMGNHKEHCLCFYPCRNFTPGDRKKNCHIANALFVLDIEFGVVTPVWECPLFEEGKP